MDCQQRHLYDCWYIVSEYVVLLYLFNAQNAMFKLDIIVKTPSRKQLNQNRLLW